MEPSFTIQPQPIGSPAGDAAHQAPKGSVEIELDRQPGELNISPVRQKRPVDVFGLTRGILGVAGNIIALPFYAVLAPGFLLGSAFANAMMYADEKDAPPISGLVLGDVIYAFKPLTNQITGINAALQGKTLREYKKEAEEESRRTERLMHSMQIRNYILQGVEQARLAPKPQALDDTTVNTKDSFELTPLMKAQTPGDVRELLAMNADVNVKDEQGLTALVRFAHSGQDELVGATLQSNKITLSDCFQAQRAVTTILEYEENAEARHKYEEIISALDAYKPPQVEPLPAAHPPQQNQGPRQPDEAQPL